jgi:hypothetical protein
LTPIKNNAIMIGEFTGRGPKLYGKAKAVDKKTK